MKKLKFIYLVLFAVLLLTEICIALFIRDNFIRPYVGDILVTVLLCSFVRIFIPNGLKLLPVYVFIFAAAVETAQYFDIVKILGLENNKFLSVLIGRTFSLHDILCYAIGCVLFFIADFFIHRHFSKTKKH
ncbi:MAG: DUF2809 domain-containing protein [Clostridia bacterium]|nr:DUF2809 domain-containing protein [Clostridia bacterium]